MNKDKHFLTFVANSLIYCVHCDCLVVGSTENPANDATIGFKARNVYHNSHWIEGPQILQKPKTDWPTNVMESSLEPDDPEVKGESTVNVTKVQDFSDPMCWLIAYFSEWKRLEVAVAWFLKMKTILCGIGCKKKKETVILSQIIIPVKDVQKKR